MCNMKFFEIILKLFNTFKIMVFAFVYLSMFAFKNKRNSSRFSLISLSYLEFPIKLVFVFPNSCSFACTPAGNLHLLALIPNLYLPALTPTTATTTTATATTTTTTNDCNSDWMIYNNDCKVSLSETHVHCIICINKC